MNGREEAAEEILSEALTVRNAEKCARLDELSGRLHQVDPATIEGDGARIAFWLNIYNALLLHCLCLRPVRGSILRHRRMFGEVAYVVGDHGYSLNVIEHGLLRGNRRPPLGVRCVLRKSDSGSDRLRPASIRGSISRSTAAPAPAPRCRPMAQPTDHQLDAATRGYLEGEPTSTRGEPESPCRA